jgi:hypothetical protein
MKLTQEELKKIALSAVFAIGGLYVYFAILLGPLNMRERNLNGILAEMEPRIRDAQREIREIANVEERLPWSEEVMAETRSKIPEGAPVAWFPPHISARLERHNIKAISSRISEEIPEPDVPGFARFGWVITLPKINAVDLGFALAALENEEPLLQITGLAIDANGEVPEFQSAVINLKSIVRK